MSSLHPTDAQLAERFRSVFARIAEGAIQRENHRELAYEPVKWLREAGFGALRVPAALGGLGASVEQWFDLLIELGEADSNLPQIFRAHFGFIERLYAEIDPPLQTQWLRRAGEGVVYGNATTERGEGALGTLNTTLTPATLLNNAWVLNGDKYYSTGTLYADWIAVSAQRLDAAGESSRVIALLPKAAEGVTCDDDWRGFGQRLSASGTTRFENALVDADHVLTYPRDRATPMTAYFQLIHLATLAGIARAIERDAVDFVRKRKRVYSHGSGGTAADDPLVQQVIGQLASAAFAAAAIVRSAAQPLGDIDRLRQAGQPIPESLIIEAELRTAKAHPVVAELVLNAATHLFDVGGASALQEDVRLDRHWRNARTLASHNPSIYKSRLVGDHAINNTRPSFYWSVGTTGG